MGQALEDRQISQDYFDWLCSLVMTEQSRREELSYVYLADCMFRVVFNDNVSNDRNRSADAVKLRHDFLQIYADNYRPMEVADLLIPSANIFEVLVAVAKLANFEWQLGVEEWFDIFLKNLKLNCYVDKEIEPGDRTRIGRLLAKFNDRRYTPRGHGGLFPLKRLGWEDQRETELWYQLSHYIEENRK